MEDKDESVPPHLRGQEPITITLNIPRQSVNDILDSGLDDASWSSIRTIAECVEYSEAPIVVPLSSAKSFKIYVANKDKPATHRKQTFILGDQHTLYDLAKAIEDVIGVAIGRQILGVPEEDDQWEFCKPSEAGQAVRTMQSVRVGQGAIFTLQREHIPLRKTRQQALATGSDV